MKINELIGLSPELRTALSNFQTEGGLPFIRGTWFFVDPYQSTLPFANASGQVFTELQDAYDVCVSGRGDGICVLSAGTGTASQTSSYLRQSLAWSKHGITVVGIAAPVSMSQRARIANQEKTTGSITTLSFDDTDGVYTINRSSGSFVTNGFEVGMKIQVATTSTTNDGNYTITAVAALSLTVTEAVTDEDAATAGATTIASYNPEMIVVSGSNNVFLNLQVANFSSNAGALGGVKVTGHRNYFGNCHIIGAGNATPGAVATAYHLKLDGGQENTFERCVFGSDSFLWAAASGAIVFDTNTWRNRFYDCEVLVYSATAGQGAINITDATSIEGVVVFKRCTFILWNENGIGFSTALVIGTKPTSGQLLFDGSSELGWSAWGATGLSGGIYIVNSDATASGAGGIATTVA